MSTLHSIDTLLMVSLLATFVILLIGKLGIRDEIIARAPKLISKLFDCDFCLSFWVAMVICIIFALLMQDVKYIIYPILTAPITRLLL